MTELTSDRFTNMRFELDVSYRAGVADPVVEDDDGVRGDPLLVFFGLRVIRFTGWDRSGPKIESQFVESHEDASYLLGGR